MAKSLAKTKQYPKLIEAFESLERNGIVFNAGSGYTEDDAIADLSEKLHKFTPEARKNVWGYCLYHEQDAARALKSKFLMISFGGRKGDIHLFIGHVFLRPVRFSVMYELGWLGLP